MENIRGNLLGYMYIVLGYASTMLLVSSYNAGVDATPCTDQTDSDHSFESVHKMCSNETSSFPRLVIDTWDTGDPDIYSCTCTVILHPGTIPWKFTTVRLKEYPGVEPTASCGSTLRISSTTSNASTEVGCSSIPLTLTNDFTPSDMVTLTLSRANTSSQWQSGHCILLTQDVISLGLILTCHSPQTSPLPGTSTYATPQIQTTTSQQSQVTTQTQQLWDTTPTQLSGETTEPKQSREPTTTHPMELCSHNIDASEMTTAVQQTCIQHGYPLIAVVAPIVVSTALVALSVAAHVILYRRRLTHAKQQGAGMTSPNPTH